MSARRRPVCAGSRPGGSGPLTPAQLRQARQLRAAGESIPNIMRTLGVAQSTLYRALSGVEEVSG
jgi:DNA invertase Pin-like site-specific DNA recombinase